VAPADIDEAVRQVREAKAGAVLLDSGLRNHDSLSVTTMVHEQVPETGIVVMGLLPHQDEIADFVRAGARGFIMREASLEEFFQTIRAVTEGGSALPRKLTASLFDEIARQRLPSPTLRDLRTADLTNRESQVLALIGEGLSNKEMAARLHVAIDTVKSHMQSLRNKLGLRTRLQIGAFARGDGERHLHSPR